MRSPLAAPAPTPHQRRHTSAASPHCQPPVQREWSHAGHDDYDDKALCPMCHLPMRVCDGHPELSDTDLAIDYARTFPAAARYEWQALMFASEQMAALSPEAARYQRRKVARE